jgi:hypothetical protein
VEAAERTARTRHRQLDPARPAQRGRTHVVARTLRILQVFRWGPMERVGAIRPDTHRRTRARIADPAPATQRGFVFDFRKAGEI